MYNRVMFGFDSINKLRVFLTKLMRGDKRYVRHVLDMHCCRHFAASSASALPQKNNS